MTLISKPLIYFLILFTSLTLLFRSGLSSFLNQEKYGMVTIIAIAYGLLLFVSGWILGKAHGINSIKFNTGLGINFAGFFTWYLVSLFWFFSGNNSSRESINSVYTAMIIRGIF